MLTSRIRALVLGLLAVMLVGSAMAATASANPGPFWRHKAAGEKGEGQKIQSKAPENFRGNGGTQTLKANISGLEIEMTAPGVQIKGAVFNNQSQGQIKLEFIFHQFTLIRPSSKECVVTVGEKKDNIVQFKGHLMWKWDENKTQLEEQPQKAQEWDIGFTGVEPQQGETELNRGSFTVVNFIGSGCGILPPKVAVTGSAVGIPNIALGTFSKTLGVRTIDAAKSLQHFWDGTAFQGTKLGLAFGPNPFTFIGQTTAEAEQQEIGVSEK